MMRSMLLQPSLEHAVEHIKKEADYYDDFRRGAKRVLVTVWMHVCKRPV